MTRPFLSLELWTLVWALSVLWALFLCWWVDW